MATVAAAIRAPVKLLSLVLLFAGVACAALVAGCGGTGSKPQPHPFAARRGTTTTHTTTTAAAAAAATPTFASETAYTYTQNRPAFIPSRVVSVSTGAQLKAAIANLQPGDLVQATADFTLSSSTSTPLTISKRLAAPAVIDLSGHTVKIVYNGTGNANAVSIKNAENIRIYGGDVESDPTDGPSGDTCVSMFASQHVTWWNFKIHDCGGGGFNMFTGKGTGYSYLGPSQHNDIEGDITRIDFNANEVDPHTEKCTGIHGMNLSDNNGYDFSNNRIAVNVHDVACIGGGIEFGTAYSSPLPTNNTIILQCSNLTYKATQQTGSNCFQTWGQGIKNTDIKYLVASNIQGHVYMASGLSSGASLTSDTVEFGRATNTLLNPFEKSKTPKIWDTKGGTVFQDVAPLP